MKKQILVPILAGVLFAAAASAQEDITVTGSTAGRKLLYDRVATIFDPGFTEVGGTLAAGSANTITVIGTMSNALPSLGTTPVTLRFAMSGSARGLSDLNAGTQLSTKNAAGVTELLPAQIAFADNWPEACTPALSSSLFTANTNLYVLPFVFFKNNGPGMAGVTNLTKHQAIMLMNSSGTKDIAGVTYPAFPATFLGGSAAGTGGGTVYLLGRDIGSGTRITITKGIGFTATPNQWATNAPGNLTNATLCAGVSGTGVLAGQNGFDSGGTLCKVTAGLTAANVIAYSGEADATSGNGLSTANWLTYEGVACSHDNVAKGFYPLWGYYHVFAKSGYAGLSANGQTILNRIIAEITNPDFQATNTLFRASGVALAEMYLKRGVDGGSVTTTTTAGF
jgi:hypothetical protein